MSNVTKDDLVGEVTRLTGVPKTIVLTTITITLETIMDLLADGKTIQIRGFGTFYTVDTPERTGYHFHKGNNIKIKPATLPKLKLSPLKLRVDSKNSTLNIADRIRIVSKALI